MEIRSDILDQWSEVQSRFPADFDLEATARVRGRDVDQDPEPSRRAPVPSLRGRVAFLVGEVEPRPHVVRRPDVERRAEPAQRLHVMLARRALQTIA